MAKLRSRWAMMMVMICLSVGSHRLMAENPAYINFETDALQQGRMVWLKNCETCHGYGIAGAPVPMNADEWQPRLKKPLETLYDHAINGFIGPDDTIMPARGDNPALSDNAVMSAVDYMIALATYYFNLKEEVK
jgi:cytochrome c5